MLARAVMHAILAIGEVASRTSDAGRGRAPAVPLAQIVGMRPNKPSTSHRRPLDMRSL